MRFSLFLLVAILFSFDANAAADIVNRNCNPDMTACMRDVGRKFGSLINPDRQVAQAQCLAQFNECTSANGGITQKSGRIAQMYNPANADFIECRKTVLDPNSDAFTACMRERTQGGFKKVELNIAQPVINIGTCSKLHPEKCTTMTTCTYYNGTWNGQSCSAAACPQGTIGSQSSEKCTCLSDPSISIDRGSGQQCPSMCLFEDHKVYDGPTKSCSCADGFRDPSGNTNNVMVCVADVTPAKPVVDTAPDCLREIQEKVSLCNSSASTAVNQCNPDRENDDTITSLQNLLKGTTSAMSASQNCAQAAIAGSTGYYALDELRGKCDTEIGTCKTSCEEATSFINANKDRIYQACRKKQYDYLSCRFDNPFPMAFTEPEWNAEWDKVNKAPFDQKIQEMQTSIADNNKKCDSGTAVTNREKMSNYMTDMDSTFQSANQCQCQLSSGSNCDKQVSLKDCSADPTMAGCANVQVNCLNTSDTSPKCVCFRDPNGDECKKLAGTPMVNTNAGINGFAAPTAVTTAGIGTESSVGGKTGIGLGADDLKNLGSDEVAGGGTSGTATVDGGSPFSPAGGGGSPGVGGNFGSGENTAASEADSSINSKLGGMFNAAKGAIGNLFGDKKNNNETSKSGAYDNSGLDANGNPIDPKKWRPGKMVRGLASGADTELAGKFEDIWRVMNKRYKVQDQKDSFIFGEKN